MDTILLGINHVQCYIDCILVTGADDKDFQNPVVFLLRNYEIQVKVQLVYIFQSSVQYLGH